MKQLKEVTNMAYKVAIDSGHYSNSAGKRSPEGYREHWITTTIAYYLDIALRRCGISTLKVAWDDKNGKDDLSDISLTNRQKMIKNAKCDISVSCHANAHGSGSTYTSAQGIETFVHSTAAKAKDSKALANKVHSYLIKGTKQTDRKVKSSNFAMCNCSAMGTKAAILIEYGFMTNKYEEELMKSESFCIECAEETAHGICDYLGVAYKNGTTTPITQPTVSTPAPAPVPTVSASTGFKHNGLDYSLVFNPTFYAALYADLKAAFGTDSSKLFNHFIQCGMNEGRIGSANFNVQAYKNRYADLQKVFGNNLPMYYQHYIQCGHAEKRQAI